MPNPGDYEATIDTLRREIERLRRELRQCEVDKTLELHAVEHDRAALTAEQRAIYEALDGIQGPGRWLHTSSLPDAVRALVQAYNARDPASPVETCAECNAPAAVCRCWLRT